MLQSIAAFAVLAVLAPVPARAHHSAAAEFDASKLLVLTGTVTKVEWTNPHVHIHLDVKPAKGAAVDWYLEMASPNGMRGLGWMPYTMKRGDVVTVEAYRAKDYPSFAKARRVKVSDGRWLYVDSGGFRVPPE
jgi:hypothetical protein